MDSGVVLAYWNEQRQQMRQSETQRSVLTNLILVIVAALSGLIVQQSFANRTLPLALVILVVGVYGALASAKYHERADYHLMQARALTELLHENGALPEAELLDQARARHQAAFPRLSRLRLHALWTGLHLGIAVYGVILAVAIAVI